MNAQIIPVRDQAVVKTAEDLNEVCNQHQNVLALVPAFALKQKELHNKRLEIAAQSIIKIDVTHNNKVLVTDVGAEKLALATEIGALVGPLSVYAEEEKDTKLANMLSNLTFSKLKLAKPLEMVATMQTFLKTAIELDAVKLAHYGIEKTVFTDLQTKVTFYQALEPQKRSSKKEKPKQTTNLKTLIKELKAIKAAMDKLVIGFKIKAPEFWAAYTNVSVVTKTTAKAKAAKAKAAKAKTGEPKTVKAKTTKAKIPRLKKGKKQEDTPPTDPPTEEVTDKTE